MTRLRIDNESGQPVFVADLGNRRFGDVVRYLIEPQAAAAGTPRPTVAAAAAVKRAWMTDVARPAVAALLREHGEAGLRRLVAEAAADEVERQVADVRGRREAAVTARLAHWDANPDDDPNADDDGDPRPT